MATVLSVHDRRILTAVNSGASSLSFIGSGFIVLCYSLFKELRKFSFKLVFYLSLSDLLCSFFNMVGDTPRISSVLLPSSGQQLLHSLFIELLLDTKPMLKIWREYFTCMFGCYCFTLIYNGASHLPMPLFSSSCPLLNAVNQLLYGVPITSCRNFACSDCDTFYCILELSDVFGISMQAVHFMTFYVPLWGAILYNGFTYFQVIRMLNNATRMAIGMSDRAYQFDSRTDTKALNRWGYYPLILIGSWAFGTINRIHDFVEPGHEIFWLSFLDVGTAGLMGLFNSIAYGLNASVRQAIYERLELFWPERLQRWFPDSSRHRNQPQQSELAALKIQDQQ
ncbi:hypothetical protein V6N11_065896 [Hibiscus sabdariffa]|uniref:G-protein coupled receptors family 2 profile 2 domain-containing protein n=1 Tax=Hibiscus sabdariffa TaxID=183260 RepID=A0ABR2PIU2_9ROSI